jgi:DNA-binding NarL/FixJ family response regulator
MGLDPRGHSWQKRGMAGVMSPMPAATSVRVFIIDDQPVCREGLVRLVSGIDGYSVCGEADSAESAVPAVSRLKPDLILLDPGLRNKSGPELLKVLPAMLPEARILVVTTRDEELHAERALRAGARGYVMKQESPAVIVQAIKSVSAGKIYLSERMAAAALSNLTQRRPQPTASAVAKLTERELDVLRCTGQGKGSREVAETLSISVKTVDTHRAHLRQKLGLKNGTELVRYAVRWVEEGAL